MTERIRCGCVPEYCVQIFTYPQRFTALVGASKEKRQVPRTQWGGHSDRGIGWQSV